MTALAAYEVSLAWEASSDASGVVSYRVTISDGRQISVTGSRTSVRITRGMLPDTSYGFSVTALDAAGNRSRPSAIVEATLPADVTAPSVPAVSATHAGSQSLSLAWTAARDDGPRVSYEVALDTGSVLSASDTTLTLTDLTPDTIYSVSVRALDPFGNASAWSEPLSVSTASGAEEDVTGPSAPRRFAVFDDYCGDVFMVWDESSDDLDPSSMISYEIYVNGSLQELVVGQDWAAFNLTEAGLTQFELIAVDTAGNASPPVEQWLVLEGGCS